MENKELRPSLPWRRLIPGTYAAETPTGETYLVERTDEGWRVVLRGPRGGREVLGEPSRIKWIGQCRAEHHYLHARKGKEDSTASKKPAAPASAARPQKPKTAVDASPARKSAEASKPEKASASAPRKGAKEPRTSHRRRRKPPPAPAKSEKPTRPEKPGAPLPAHSLAWKVSQQNGREFHVAEHEGGLFKILEVKGTEGFALFSEPTGGVVQEIQCGSLADCKQKADALRASKGGKKKREAAPAKSPPKADAGAPREGAAKPACECQPAPEPAKEPAPKIAPASATGAAAKPIEPAKQARIMEGLKSALRNVNPPTLRGS